ncbi:hypothetical protein A9G28_00750 [Gilliamella sp. Fer1-1]|jgi:hypothetical protein|uniref:hypothetical protein n=1 Tax=unclassified Gilliamella TaxID=2685620 RepID=UPI00080E3462|nr:hypothetical protein [Gilliamella apicola]OCG15510.1 hypothetical protein A9G47_11725 [Gilliamella apicola]OCG43267.1 hypothetical protein A9G28_00750 [Gilliamella apicola]
MWHDLIIDNVVKIEKSVAEFVIWMPILPYAKMKIKIYESSSRRYTGMTDLAIKRKFDRYPENGLGSGDTVEEALKNTLKNFNAMLTEDGFEELTPEDIEYSEWSDF